MVHIVGCGSRSPFSNKNGMSFAFTFSYGRSPNVNISHSVTPAKFMQNYKFANTILSTWSCFKLCFFNSCE